MSVNAMRGLYEVSNSGLRDVARWCWFRRCLFLFRNVPAQQHVDNPGGRPVVEAGIHFISLWVPERAKDDVEDRQVRVVVLVQAFSMVNRVALGPLHEVTEPLRRFDVGMLENSQEHRCKQKERNSLRTQANDQRQTKASE